MRAVEHRLVAEMLNRLCSLVGVTETAEEIAIWLESQGVISMFIDYDKLQSLRSAIRFQIPEATFVTEIATNAYQLVAAELVRSAAEAICADEATSWNDDQQVAKKAVEYLQGFRRFEQMPELVIILSAWAEEMNENEYQPLVKRITSKTPKSSESRSIKKLQSQAFPDCMRTEIAAGQLKKIREYMHPAITLETIPDEKQDIVYDFCCGLYGKKAVRSQREAMEVLALNNVEREVLSKVLFQQDGEMRKQEVEKVHELEKAWMKEHAVYVDAIFCYFSIMAFELVLGV